MKKLLLLLLVVGLFLLTACDFKVTVNGSGEKVEPVVQSVQKSDEELLDYFNENISIVEDRKEFFDNSGELYCYVEKDYLETSSDDPGHRRRYDHRVRIAGNDPGRSGGQPARCGRVTGTA